MNNKSFKIMIVDDEKSFSSLLEMILSDEGYTVVSFNDPEEALREYLKFNPNLILTDLKMPKIDGIELINQIRSANQEIDFIVLTAFATVNSAVEAMKKGAIDYLTKPLKNPDELRKAVKNVIERQKLSNENKLLKSFQLSDVPPIDIIFSGIEEVLKDITDVSPTNATVMLYGETGTGKSLIAKVIHNLSNRQGPFVELNCAAIPENLLESELFGYEKGAFTGATTSKKGKFELADEGTIFLDEVSEMSLSLQTKFLKILQDKTFERLGSLETLKTNARIISATNRDLKILCSEKKFREDLYYRLNVFPIQIKPLRERRDSIKAIADYLVKTISLKLGKTPVPLDTGSIKRMMEYSWPGNIRELSNVIERAIIVNKANTLTITTLDDTKQINAEDNVFIDEVNLNTIERLAIEKALKSTGGNRKEAALKLGISLRTLQYKIKDYKIGHIQ
ncbi:MAG: sigma-54 dependent transcriptional regulator [Thermodesulfovibrionales bacterium]|nr:sigma-54 dependent transcriptional regulator [Thermodesulfovibrionales bacterium]